MSTSTILTILGSLGFPTIVAALIAFFGTRSTLKANQPKSEAETDQVQASTNVQNLTAQSSVIATLVSENIRLSDRVTALEARGEAADKRYDELLARYNGLLGTHDDLRRLNVRMRSHIEQADAWISRSLHDTDDPPPAAFVFPSA